MALRLYLHHRTSFLSSTFVYPMGLLAPLTDGFQKSQTEHVPRCPIISVQNGHPLGVSMSVKDRTVLSAAHLQRWELCLILPFPFPHLHSQAL